MFLTSAITTGHYLKKKKNIFYVVICSKIIQGVDIHRRGNVLFSNQVPMHIFKDHCIHSIKRTCTIISAQYDCFSWCGRLRDMIISI